MRYAVSPAYFETMRIPLRRGRLLDERDTTGAPVAVVISESFAKRKFPGRTRLGSGFASARALATPTSHGTRLSAWWAM